MGRQRVHLPFRQFHLPQGNSLHQRFHLWNHLYRRYHPRHPTNRLPQTSRDPLHRQHRPKDHRHPHRSRQPHCSLRVPPARDSVPNSHRPHRPHHRRRTTQGRNQGPSRIAKQRMCALWGSIHIGGSEGRQTSTWPGRRGDNGATTDGSARLLVANRLWRPLPPAPSPLQERGSQKQMCAEIRSKCAEFPGASERILQVRHRSDNAFPMGSSAPIAVAADGPRHQPANEPHENGVHGLGTREFPQGRSRWS